jgi:hypothetical protein
VIEPIVASALGTPTVERDVHGSLVAHATMESELHRQDQLLGARRSPAISGRDAGRRHLSPANASKLTGLPTSAITVNTTFLGGGLGRKIEQDYIWQAIQVAMAVKKPVKLTWKREEDFGHDQYRPFALTRVRATLDAGRIKAWWYRTASQAITGQRGRLAAGAVDSQAVEGAVHLAYDLGTDLVEWVPLNVGHSRRLLALGRRVHQCLRRRERDGRAREGGRERGLVRVPRQPHGQRAGARGQPAAKGRPDDGLVAQVAASRPRLGDGDRDGV